MFSRDIARRLVRLEADRHGHGIRYVVSDRLLSDAEWHADMAGNWLPADCEAQPELTVAEWVSEFCS